MKCDPCWRRLNCLLLLSLLTNAALPADAVASVRLRRLGTRHGRGVDDSQNGTRPGLRVHRLAGLHTELHVSEAGPKRSFEIGSSDAGAASAGRIFFQMDSVTQHEQAPSANNATDIFADVPEDVHAGGRREQPVQIPVESSTAIDDFSAVVPGGSAVLDTTGDSSANVSDSALAAAKGETFQDELSKDVFVQSVGESDKSKVTGWLKDLVAVGVAGAEVSNTAAVDRARLSEDEANYSAESEGIWFSNCMVGLAVLMTVIMCLTRPNQIFCLSPRKQTPSVQSVADPVDMEAEATQEMPPPPVEENVTEMLEVVSVPDLLRTMAETIPAAQKGPLEFVTNIPASSTEEVLNKLEAVGAHAGGYDCALARPLRFSQPLRLQAVVLPRPGGEMLAPLTLQSCVLYQVTVSRRLHAGMAPVPVAFSSMNVSFQIAPCDRLDLRMGVEGEDVFLFNMLNGNFSHTGPFGKAPERLQDFVVTHRGAVPGGQWQGSSALRMEADMLDFQECALLVGAKVTVVGEMARGAGGALELRPTEFQLAEFTSSQRVMVSDDPELLA